MGGIEERREVVNWWVVMVNLGLAGLAISAKVLLAYLLDFAHEFY